MGSKAVLLKDAVVLYADLDGSTNMVALLHCAAKPVKAKSVVITAYDGDKIILIFIGENKYDCAVRTGLKLRWAVTNIIQLEMKAQYNTVFILAHTVGIDISDLHAVPTGVRGVNDFVWVGRSANYAAKLATLNNDYPTLITKNVFDKLSEPSKTASNGRAMWEARSWTSMNKMTIYRSAWSWI